MKICIVSLCVALAAIVGAGSLYMEWAYIGFPDGHRSAIDHAHEIGYPLFAVAALGLAAWALRIAHRVLRLKKVGPRQLLVFALLSIALPLGFLIFESLCTRLVEQLY